MATLCADIGIPVII